MPGALDGHLLADRVGRGNAFSLAVARSAHAAQHGVDFVLIPLRISQTLQQKNGGAFAHDEAVGSFGVRTRAGGRECADLAELHKSRGPHVAINAAGDGDVKIVLHQSLDRRADGRHR